MGKQHTVVYQGHYGNQTRRMLKDKKDEHTRGQLEQRDRFRVGIDFAKSLTKAQRDFIKSYMAEAGIRSPDGLPTTWYSFSKKIAMTRPKVEMETEASSGFDAPYGSWGYRKPITLNNQTGGTLSNHQILVTLTTENFTYAKCKNDGSDIRFAASDKTTPLSYWLEDWNYNGTSKLWVKVNNIPTGQNICAYLYYGNEAAESESNGDNTFIFFDDFPGSSIDLDKWEGDTSYITVAANIMTLTSDSNWRTLRTKAAYMEDYETCFMSKTKIEGRTTNKGGAIAYRNSAGDKVIDFIYFSALEQIRHIPGGTTQDVSISEGDYHIYEIARKTATIDAFFEDGIQLGSDITDGNVLGALPPTFQSRGGTGYRIFSKWTILRKYASPVPSVNTLGDEEAGGSSATLSKLVIRHPAIKSYEILDNGPKEENLSDLEDHITTVITRTNLNLAATKIKVKTLANQEYEFTVK